MSEGNTNTLSMFETGIPDIQSLLCSDMLIPAVYEPTPLDPSARAQVEKIRRAAENSFHATIAGIGALGELLAVAACHKEDHVNESTLRTTGFFIQELANQVYALQQLRDDAQLRIDKADQWQAMMARTA